MYMTQQRSQGGLEALPIMPCVWTIISFFSITWQFICYGFHRSRVANRSGISRKKAYLFPLLRSWSTGKCSVRTIYLSSSEISSWPRQFPWENRRTKDVRVFISEESDRCSEGSPISNPFGSDKQLWYQGKLLSVSFLGLAWLWLHSLFSAIEAHFHCCVHTCTDHDRINLLRFPYRLNTVLSEGKILRKLSSFNEPFPTCLTALILGQASRRSLLGLVCVWIIH